jgi:LPS-assembly lipoprotein
MLARRAFVLGLPAALGACGFRPLFGQADHPEVRDQLAAIEIAGLDSRLGQLVRNALLEELNPSSLSVPARYQLLVAVRETSSSLGIQLDSTITRYNLTLIARFRLLDLDSRELLYQSTVRRIASYNVPRQPYAELAAERDAEQRAAKEVGTNIRTLLAVHFARQTPTV